MTARRVLVVALLGLVLSLGALAGGALAPATSTAVESAGAVPTAVEHGQANASLPPAALGTPADGYQRAGDGAPCIVRADCGGAAWLLGGASLLLAVLVTVPAIGGPVLVTPATRPPRKLLSQLLAGRLFRPPQLT
jgi:hypothetical protein